MASRARVPTLGRGARLMLGAALFAFILAIAVLLLEPKWRPYYELSTAPAPTWLPVPVAGVRANALVDTWGAERSGGRTHKGIDIFARRGTAILSPVRGVVVGIGQDRLGGNVVRILGPGRQVHYFAHLERFAAIEQRQWVTPGHVIGYVGDTGNARGTPPHLHYGVYGATGAINPYPLLRPRPNASARLTGR